MMTSLLRKMVVDVPALTENAIVPLRVSVCETLPHFFSSLVKLATVFSSSIVSFYFVIVSAADGENVASGIINDCSDC